MSTPLAEVTSVPIVRTPTAWRRWLALALVGLGVLLFLAQYAWVAAPEVLPAMPIFMASFWGPMICTVLLGLGWVIVGPGTWRTRLVLALLVVALLAASVFAAHPSARFFLAMKGIPAAAGVVVLSWVFGSFLPAGLRAVAALGLGLLALLPWEFAQFNGVTGQFGMDPQWRWRPNAEDVAASFDEGNRSALPVAEVLLQVGRTDWPAFRGPRQDGVVSDIDVGDWQTKPAERWRRPVGPAWSSCCVIGDRLFTQEQRGEQELVVCYSASTGSQLWATGDAARYSDMPSGVGPRGTPAFHAGKVYTFGATGILNCLDATNGNRLWRVDLKEAVGATGGPFGLASSPLVVGKLVLVHPGSPTGSRLVAFDAQTGKQQWAVGTAAVGYSTPHPATLAGVPQVLVFNGDGLFAHDLVTGKELWSYEWKAETTAPVVVQPTLLPDDRIVLGSGRPGVQSRCIQVRRTGETWTAEKVWEARFYPAFNDYVRFGDYLYGLESGRLVCVNANTGKRQWKEGHYGAGQVLGAGNRLIVLSESGRLALINPNPEAWQELQVIEALSDKSWNHPVIANGRLFVRNAREMVCYQLNP